MKAFLPAARFPSTKSCEQRRDQQQGDSEFEQRVAHSGVQVGVADRPEQVQPDEEGLRHDPRENQARDNEMCDAEPMRHAVFPSPLDVVYRPGSEHRIGQPLYTGCLHPVSGYGVHTPLGARLRRGSLRFLRT